MNSIDVVEMDRSKYFTIAEEYKPFLPIFSLISVYQDYLFGSQLEEIINIIISDKGPMCIYRNPYDEKNHYILLAIDPNHPYQAAYQFSHEYSHLKMKFWKTYDIEEYRFKFLEEAIAYCASIVTLHFLSSANQYSQVPVPYSPDGYIKYALDNLKEVIPLSPKSLPTWLNDNFPFPLGSDFCCCTDQSGDRERSKILGYNLIKCGDDHGFWKAASVLTEACSSYPQSYPATIEELFERWIPFCSPDAAQAVATIRKVLLSPSQAPQDS